MGLFYHHKDSQYSVKGSQNWLIAPGNTRIFQVQGTFQEFKSNGSCRSLKLYANQEEIFYYKDDQIHYLTFYLTVLEEHFCFYNHKKIYQIKLKRKNTLTILSTANPETFIEFYLFLAKHCILTTFEKHYKICLPSHILPNHPDPYKLGRGAYSIVYNGENIISKEQVALKIFKKSQIGNFPHLYQIIENQICVLQKLKKYHLSPLINVYETEDCIIFVLLKAEAGNMLDFLSEHQQDYNSDFIKMIMCKVLDNLKQLHRAGFIHRDIKPQNILFKNSMVKSSLFLGDFGLTVPIHPTQDYDNKIGRICSGTLGFIAPQIIHTKSYNEKCDMFSIGCLFYFLHKGRSLFFNKTVAQISKMTENSLAIDSKISQLDNLTPESYQLMQRLLKLEPSQRPSAQQALNFQYFKNIEHNKPETGQDDHTLRQYLLNRISHYYYK